MGWGGKQGGMERQGRAKRYELAGTKQSRDATRSSHIVTTTCAARWELGLLGASLCELCKRPPTALDT